MESHVCQQMAIKLLEKKKEMDALRARKLQQNSDLTILSEEKKYNANYKEWIESESNLDHNKDCPDCKSLFKSYLELSRRATENGQVFIGANKMFQCLRRDSEDDQAEVTYYQVEEGGARTRTINLNLFKTKYGFQSQYEALIYFLTVCQLENDVSCEFDELLVQDQRNREICYAITISAAIIMTIYRIEGRLRTESGKISETALKCLREKLIKTYGIEGADTHAVLKEICPEYGLGFLEINETLACHAVHYSRAVVTSFALTPKKMEKFQQFLQNKENEKRILTTSHLDIGEDDTVCKLVGHAVLLIGYTPKYLLFMNSWGLGSGHKGFFRVESSKVFNAVKFFEIGYDDSELTKEEVEAFERRKEALASSVEYFHTCPFCSRISVQKGFSSQRKTIVCKICQHEYIPEALETPLEVTVIESARRNFDANRLPFLFEKRSNKNWLVSIPQTENIEWSFLQRNGANQKNCIDLFQPDKIKLETQKSAFQLFPGRSCTMLRFEHDPISGCDRLVKQNINWKDKLECHQLTKKNPSFETKYFQRFESDKMNVLSAKEDDESQLTEMGRMLVGLPPKNKAKLNRELETALQAEPEYQRVREIDDPNILKLLADADRKPSNIGILLHHFRNDSRLNEYLLDPDSRGILIDSAKLIRRQNSSCCLF